MYRATLTCLFRSVSARQHLRFSRILNLPHKDGWLPAKSPSVSVSHFFSRTSFYQDKNDIAQSSNATGRMEEAALSEIIFAMKNVPGLFEIYENFKGTVPMVQRHRVEIFYCVTNIAMGELEQKELLTSELSQNGKNSLFLELLDQITKGISGSSERDLAFILWSFGRLIDIVGEMNDLVHACEAEILSRDLKAFDIAAVNQILTGLAACRKKDSEIWSKVEKSILSGEIKITDFSNAELVGSLMGFSKARSVTSELFEHYREAIESHRMPSFKDFELSQMVFAFAKKGVEAEKLYSYTEQEILLRGIKGFLDKNLFLIPWAFANCKSNRRYDRLFQLIDEEFVLRGVQGCSNGVISNLVWCFSKVGLYDAEIFDVVKNEVLVRGVESFQRDPQLLWSFARAKGSAYPDLGDKIVLWFLSTDLSTNHTKDLCLYTWCFQKLGITSESVYQALEMELLQRNLSKIKFVQLNQLVSGFVFAKRGNRKFFEHLEAVFLKFNLSTLNTSEVVCLLRLFSKMEFKVSEFYHIAEKELLQRGKSQVAIKEIREL